MSFHYTPFPREEAERRWQRALSVLPAALSWALLGGLAVLSLTVPSAGAALMIALLLYYVFRLVHNGIFLTISFLRVRAEEKTDWIGRLSELDSGADPSAPSASAPRGIAARVHRSVLRAAREAGLELPRLDRLVHLVIIPICNEPRSVWEPAVRALQSSTLDPRRFLVVVLSVEERSAPGVIEEARALRELYRSRFRDFLVLVHPAGLPGEIPGKGSNVGWAARGLTGYLAERSISFADAILSCIDADALVSPQYFACLSYYFLAEPRRTRSCFQPLPVFSNNIWRVPALIRVVEMGATVLQLIDSTSTELLVTFSCYSYSFEALAESGFWPPDVIAEDAAVFWKTFLHFRGDFRAVPIPVTVHMDAAEGPTFLRAIRNAYRQKLRWAYGAENLATVLRGVFRHGLVRGRRRWTTVLKLVENSVSMTSWPFILSVFSWAPQLYNLLSNTSPLAMFNLGRISAVIFMLSGAFLALLVLVTGFFAYRASAGAPLLKKILYPLEWLVVLPFASMLFGGAAALHAQTRLAVGKPLAYVVMEKIR